MIYSSSQIKVRYAETDKMNVVYHSNYLVWFDIARTQMLEEIGLPYRDLEADGYFIPVLTANLEYLRSARFDDILDVQLRVMEKPRVRMRFEYEIKRANELIAIGATTHGFIDIRGNAQRPPKNFLQKINEIWPPKQSTTKPA